MNKGLQCPLPSHKDYEFFGSFGLVGTVPSFPPDFNTDAGLGMPDQNADGQPFGCTNYSQADLATDLTSTPRIPAMLEDVTHANASGGYSIRESMDAARKLGWFKWYFNLQQYDPLDWFDTIRYAQLIASGTGESRSVSIGTPWFPSWEQAALTKQPVLPMPTPEEITAIAKNSNAFGWHNWDCKGWTPVNGSPMLRCKSWQGTRVGTAGWLYVPREVVNVVMSLKYTVAYVPTMVDTPVIARVSLPLLQYFMSFIRNAYHYYASAMAL